MYRVHDGAPGTVFSIRTLPWGLLSHHNHSDILSLHASGSTHSFPPLTSPFSFSTATNYQLTTPCTEGKLINKPSTETIRSSCEDVISRVFPCMKMFALKLFFFGAEVDIKKIKNCRRFANRNKQKKLQ